MIFNTMFGSSLGAGRGAATKAAAAKPNLLQSRKGDVLGSLTVRPVGHGCASP